MAQALPEQTIDDTLEFDSSGAIERLLSDAADVAGHEYASTALPALKQSLLDAFSTGNERPWRAVYAHLANIAANTTAGPTAAAGRLHAFLAENNDLSNHTS